MSFLPKTLGRYEIESELGRGMMGVVYAARDPALGRTVALKTINVVFAISESERSVFEQRFLSEARFAAGLSHPNIVVVHDVGRDEATGTPYIAFEYLKGESLSDLVPPPMDWREALRIIGAIADALHHAHTLGIVHRDIKPGNVMLLPNRTPKLMDFGVARAPTSNLTAAGEFFGTPSYMSPEQASGDPVDGRSDLFSLGAVLYFLLTGQRAFEGRTVPAILAKVEGEPPPKLSELAPDVPLAVGNIINRLLEKVPGNRYQNGKQLQEDVEDLLGGSAPRHAGGPAPTEDQLLVPVEVVDEMAVAPPAGTAPGRVAATAPASVGAGRSGARASGLAWSAVALLGLLLLGTFLVQRRGTGSPAPPTTLAARVAASAPPGTTPPSTTDAATPAAPSGKPSASTKGTARRPEPAPAPAAVAATIPAASAAPPSPGGLPEAASGAASEAPRPAPDAARLTIAVEHGVKDGLLTVLIDRQKRLQKALAAQETKKALIFKGRKGQLFDVIDIPAGTHHIRVEVREGRDTKAGQLAGYFKVGETRLLEVKVGGAVELEWR